MTWDAEFHRVGGSGVFVSDPAVVTWDGDHVAVFAIGDHDGGHPMYYSSRDPIRDWQPSWDNLGGDFISEPAVTSWSRNRLDVFGTGMGSAIYHTAWNGNSWQSDWDSLRGKFTSPPLVVSRVQNTLDGLDRGVYHKSWDGSK